MERLFPAVRWLAEIKQPTFNTFQIHLRHGMRGEMPRAREVVWFGNVFTRCVIPTNDNTRFSVISVWCAKFGPLPRVYDSPENWSVHVNGSVAFEEQRSTPRCARIGLGPNIGGQCRFISRQDTTGMITDRYRTHKISSAL